MDYCHRCNQLVPELHKNTYVHLCNNCYHEFLDMYKDISIYRFISINDLEKTLTLQTLNFKLPSSWTDTLEDVFYKTLNNIRKQRLMDPIAIREFLACRDSLYFQCWTLTPESQFFWDTYGNIRIEAKIKDFFEMGIRPVAIRYIYLFSIDEYRSVFKPKSFTNKKSIFYVDENNEYHGNYWTNKMRYNMYVYNTILDYVWEFQTNCEKIPIALSSTLKHTKYAIENEVRLALYYSHNPLYKDYLNKHRQYINNLFSKYNDFDNPIDTEMEKVLLWSFKEKPNLIKSVLCHPKMKNNDLEKVKSLLKSLNLEHLFIGQSKLFYNN